MNSICFFCEVRFGAEVRVSNKNSNWDRLFTWGTC